MLDKGTMNYCGSTYPTGVFFGGDSPWLRHVLRITTHWMVASLYNFGIWQDRTLVGFDLKPSAAANAMWHELVGTKQLPSVEGRGCTHKPLTRVPVLLSQVVMRILHGLTCIRRIVANQVHTLCVCHDPAVAVEVGHILREYKSGITPKDKAEPYGEESWQLLVAWKKLSGVLLIDNAINAAVTGMARALTALYQGWHDPEALNILQAARAFGKALCPDSKSPYLVFFIHDCKSGVENIKPYGMGMFSGDLLESAKKVKTGFHC